MILLLSAAHAGLIDSLSAEERQVAICRQASSPAEEVFDYRRAAAVWETCLDEAKRLGHTRAVPLLEDQVQLLQARARAAPWRTSDPNRYALDVLAAAAEQRSTQYLGSDVADVFRAWMTTEPGKQRLEPVRTVTLQWSEPPASEEEGRRAAEIFRRHLEDLGLKWADAGHPEVDVIVYAALGVGPVEEAGGTAPALPRAEARFEVERVRFRTIDAETDGFHATAVAEDPERARAEEQALRGACEKAAARLLKDVLRTVFR